MLLLLFAVTAALLWHGLISISPFLLQPLSLQSGDTDLKSSLVTCVCWLHAGGLSCLWLQEGAVLWGVLQGAGAVRWALLGAGGGSSVLGMRLENYKLLSSSRLHS